MEALIFVVGCCFGSFINCISYRLEHSMSFIKGRSICEYCGNILKYEDLIPILGWLFLRGRCRYCHHKIRFSHCVMEFLAGLSCLICYWFEGINCSGLCLFAILLVLLMIGKIDVDTLMISDILLLILFFLGCLYNQHVVLWQRFVAMGLISSLMLLMNYFFSDCFGGGDVKLVGVMGFVLGIEGIVFTFLFAVILGGFHASILLLLKKQEKYMPFGPHLCAGFFISLLYSEVIISSYLGYL